MVFRHVGNNFIWTKSGLKKINELSTGHEILGIDKRGYSCWFKIKNPPLMKSAKEKLLRILLDRCEIIVAPECEVCKRGGIIYAKEVMVGDKLEVFCEPEHILMEISRDWKTKIEDEIYIEGYGLVKLTPQTSYLLGILSQRTEVPALWSQGIVVVKIPTVATELVTNKLEELLHDFNLIDVRGDENWSCIEFKSKIVDLVRHLPSAEKLVTRILNSSFPLLHSFMKGIIATRTASIDGIKRIIMKVKEIKLRKVLYNLLFIHSIECCTCVAKHLGEQSVYYIDVSSKDLQTFNNMETSPKSLNAWVVVKEVNEIKSTSYLLSNGEKNFWSPVIDLVVLA